MKMTPIVIVSYVLTAAITVGGTNERPGEFGNYQGSLLLRSSFVSAALS